MSPETSSGGGDEGAHPHPNRSIAPRLTLAHDFARDDGVRAEDVLVRQPSVKRGSSIGQALVSRPRSPSGKPHAEARNSTPRSGNGTFLGDAIQPCGELVVGHRQQSPEDPVVVGDSKEVVQSEVEYGPAGESSRPACGQESI